MTELKSTYSRTDKIAGLDANNSAANSQLQIRLHKIGEENVGQDNPYDVKRRGLQKNQASSVVSLPSLRSSNTSPAQAAILKRKMINSTMN